MQVIARVRNDFPTKFGLPRQSGLVPELVSTIVFEPEFRVAEALRGIASVADLGLPSGGQGKERRRPEGGCQC